MNTLFKDLAEAGKLNQTKIRNLISSQLKDMIDNSR